MNDHDYDSSEEIDWLIGRLYTDLGPAVMRMCGPELEAFIRYRVKKSLETAWTDASLKEMRHSIDATSEAICTVFEGLLKNE